MNRHEHDGHAEALAAWLGARADLPGEAQAAFEASPWKDCASCREEVGEHHALARRLEAVGRAERADLSAARRAPAPAAGPAEEALRRAILADARRSARASSSARLPWGWIAAAAAAVLALAVWVRREGRDAGPGDPGPLLGAEIELLHPRDEVASFAPFQWRDRAPRVGWYRVVVLPVGREDEPLDSGPLRATSWTPEPALAARFGTEIHWRLEVYGGAGEGDLIESVGAWARLSSR